MARKWSILPFSWVYLAFIYTLWPCINAFYFKQLTMFHILALSVPKTKPWVQLCHAIGRSKSEVPAWVPPSVFLTYWSVILHISRLHTSKFQVCYPRLVFFRHWLTRGHSFSLYPLLFETELKLFQKSVNQSAPLQIVTPGFWKLLSGDSITSFIKPFQGWVTLSMKNLICLMSIMVWCNFNSHLCFHHQYSRAI